MTVSGSFCTRPLIDRTLICNAILYYFQITFKCGPINRLIIPPTLFLLSRPLEQLEFIRSSNSIAEICCVPVTRPNRYMLPRNFQSRYRRHLSNIKHLSQLPLARRSLNQLSRLRIHLVQEFKIRSIQSRQNMRETNIVVLHDQIPHIPLPHSSFFLLFFFFSFFLSFFLSLVRVYARCIMYAQVLSVFFFSHVICEKRQLSFLRKKKELKILT